MSTGAPDKTFADYLKSTSEQHSVLEDAQGIAAGAMLASLGVLLLSSAGLLTGGTAGLAFLLHYATGFSFGAVFFVVNLPFYYLAWKRLGLAFTVKTFSAIAATSAISEALPRAIGVTHIDPLVAAVFGGLLVGSAMLALFRHRASLGGFGVLALYLQEKLGWRAGFVQLGFDCCVLFFSFFVASPFVIACSIFGAVVTNMILAINHRRDRYIAM
jgi:uncharacterized membrane-anchored protein YitT (DUF2179 family)